MNRRLTMTPTEACKAITNAPPDTHSIPIYYGGTDTTANTDNVGYVSSNGVIG